jgi:hypothetical protein
VRMWERQDRQARVGSKQVCSLTRVLRQGVEGREGAARRSELGRGKGCSQKSSMPQKEKGKLEREAGAGAIEARLPSQGRLKAGFFYNTRPEARGRGVGKCSTSFGGL